MILILERRFTCNTKTLPKNPVIHIYINAYAFIQWYSIIFTSILNNMYLYTYLLYFQVYQTDIKREKGWIMERLFDIF